MNLGHLLSRIRHLAEGKSNHGSSFYLDGVFYDTVDHYRYMLRSLRDPDGLANKLKLTKDDVDSLFNVMRPPNSESLPKIKRLVRISTNGNGIQFDWSPSGLLYAKEAVLDSGTPMRGTLRYEDWSRSRNGSLDKKDFASADGLTDLKQATGDW